MLEIGSVIDGKYKILTVVGKGGMSVVYLAMNERANKQWAIKEIRKDGVQNYEVVKQNLIVETELLKKFNHPNLPSIVDVIDGDGTFYIVMDYIEGIPLSKAIAESGAQSQDDVIEWSKQLCDVLGYLHSRKPPIIYRDMKPSNVMLKPDGTVMLIDFGTAREFKSTSVADTTCLGTQGYAAPEQFGGQGQTDARTDIYCLGATMYHLLTGHNPATPPYEMYPIRQWNPTLSSGLEEIVLKCTQKNPADRYQSCAELLYALDHYTDLDIENKKVQNLKWKTFIVCLISTFVMLLGTIGFGVAEKTVISSSYNGLIDKAKLEKSTARGFQRSVLDIYIEAIHLDPERLTAYEGLIAAIGSDEEVEQEEWDCLKDLMYDTHDYINSALEADPEGFADNVAYPCAVNLYFNMKNEYSNTKNEELKFEGRSNSQWWFEIVVQHSKDEKKLKRSQLLLDLSENYKKLGSLKKDGDSERSYSDYFEDLKFLCSPDLDTDENITIAFKVYVYCVTECSIHYDLFMAAGVTPDEMEEFVDNIEKYTDKIKENPSYEVNEASYDVSYNKVKDEIKRLRLNIDNARGTTETGGEETGE